MAAVDASADGLFTVRTDVFEGPLDLLLYLVKREGVDLANLPIASIADAYVAFLERMRALDLSLAADWLVMAATLVYLKSLEILPRPPAALDDEQVDPREKLRIQLEAYERVKAGAEMLEARPRTGRDVFARAPTSTSDGPRPVTTPVTAFGLLDLYFELLQRTERPPPVVEFDDGGPDVGVCCRRVLDGLGYVGATLDLTGLLTSLGGPPERVVTFVAVLEMARLRWLEVSQDEHLGPVTIRQRVEMSDMELELVMGDMVREDDPLGDPDGEAQPRLPFEGAPDGE